MQASDGNRLRAKPVKASVKLCALLFCCALGDSQALSRTAASSRDDDDVDQRPAPNGDADGDADEHGGTEFGRSPWHINRSTHAL